MVTHDPLHGSGRADFPHPALALGDDDHASQRIRMLDANRREAAVNQPPHPVPRDTPVLTTASLMGQDTGAVLPRLDGTPVEYGTAGR